MARQVLTLDDLRVGDILEINDPGGSSVGDVGDSGELIKIDDSDNGAPNFLCQVKLHNGKDAGRVTGRYQFRFKKLTSDWDR